MKITISNITFSIVFGVLFCLSSCEETQPEISGEENRPFFRLASRADGTDDADGRTYRLMFYKEGDLTYCGSGTYDTGEFDAITGASMRPRILNGDGSVNNDVSKDDHKNAYIQPDQGKYQVVCISPGVKCKDDGGIDLMPNSDEVLITAKELLDIKGFGHYTIKNKLIEPRSKIHLKFFKDKVFDGKVVEIANVILSGAGTSGGTVTFYPNTNQVISTADSKIEIELTEHENATADYRDFSEIYNSKNPVYVISAIYAPKKIVEQTINKPNAPYKDSDYLVLSFDLSQEGQKPGTVSLQITNQYPQLKPKYEYTYEIVIQKEYVQLNMSIQADAGQSGWQSAGQGTQTIDEDYKISINVGTWSIADGGWTTKNLGNQSIGNQPIN